MVSFQKNVKPVPASLTSQSETVNVGAGAQSDSILNDMKFQSWVNSSFAPYTRMNTLRALRHLENNGVILRDRGSFQDWVGVQRQKGVPPSTCNDYIKPYNRILSYLEEYPRIKLLQQPKTRPRRAEMSDYEALIAACHGFTKERDTLIIDLAFKCGLRVGDAFNLTLKGVQTGSDWMILRGKGKKEGIVWLPLSIRNKSLPDYLKTRRANPGVNKLFTTKEGVPFTYNGFRRIVYELSKRAGIRFSMHMGRRFYSRWLKSEGMAIEDISAAIRHESIEVTRQYMQLDATDMLTAFRRVRPDFHRKR